jgi:hypothetical protein
VTPDRAEQIADRRNKGNLSMVNRVIGLRVEVPTSTGPGDAARALGTTVDAWIETAS